MQLVYRSTIDTQRVDCDVVLEHYNIYKIDEGFVNSINNLKCLNNPELIIEYIEQFWGTVENYLRMGYGYVAVYDGQIVSFGVTSSIYDKTFSIGVETLEEHRQKGLARLLISKLFNDLYDKGYDIWWDCMDSNLPSQKTAETSGLVLDHKYKVCWFGIS